MSVKCMGINHCVCFDVWKCFCFHPGSLLSFRCKFFPEREKKGKESKQFPSK